MKKYKPNFVSLKVRIWSAVGAVYLLCFMTAILAMGYVFLPGKRSGVLLSGFPTLMIAIGALTLCAAIVLTIVDHYDARQNEHVYKAAKIFCYKITAVLFIGAPIIEILEAILLYNGIDVLPNFHGFAENYTFYSPAFNEYSKRAEGLVDATSWVVLAFFVFGASGWAINKYLTTISKRVVVLLFGISMLCLSFSILVFTLNDFLSGETSNADIVYRAVEEPAKFNAILLTNFVIGAVMLLASMVAVVGLISNRIKVSSESF